MNAKIIDRIGGKVKISLKLLLENPTPEMIRPTEFLIITDVARKILAIPKASGENAKIIGKGKFNAFEKDDVHNSAGEGATCLLYFAINLGVTIPIMVTNKPAKTGYNHVKPVNFIFTIDVNIKIGVKIFIVNFTNLPLYCCRGDLIHKNPKDIPK
ncbi:MAG: hypothetical protein GPJ54_14200 [Candidatus Heimdallarchaeota archaeon]|nr:hypothetical protein [Candidatus Heimdallarchaeota archaeon]